MRLEEIGFYTLSDARAQAASVTAPLARGELLLTSRCNFRCQYCRGSGEETSFEVASSWVRAWAAEGLRAIRFSGGEPLLYPKLRELVQLAHSMPSIERIAVSTNGSFPLSKYLDLVRDGVNDFSISLDACCAADGAEMADISKAMWARVARNIRELARHVYVTVGVVLTETNRDRAAEIVAFASSLGVADVRVIPAAQDGASLTSFFVADDVLARHPILRYRVDRLRRDLPVRGLGLDDSKVCMLVLDDVAATGQYQYPCVIYLREGGAPIGKFGYAMREARRRWCLGHDSLADPICRRNCLDVCTAYNNFAAASVITGRRRRDTGG